MSSAVAIFAVTYFGAVYIVNPLAESGLNIRSPGMENVRGRRRYALSEAVNLVRGDEAP
jgi:hypothetical protein